MSDGLSIGDIFEINVEVVTWRLLVTFELGCRLVAGHLLTEFRRLLFGKSI